MTSDWLRMSATELGTGIARGDIDPVDLTETYLSAIDAHDLTPRIFARITHDRARAEARAASARARAGLRRSALDGVPITWKDVFDTAGIATEAGSALLRGRTPERDAAVLRNATLSGLVCLGKTHMSELAFSGLGYNPVTATPPSVNDADAVAGGSSSGAAASVAFGLAAAGIGSDTGGSVRVPAAWNDLVGLKTTPGLLPNTGIVPLCPFFDTVGPLCRNVSDAALMLGALGSRKPADLKGASLVGRRFLIPTTLAMDDLVPQVAAGFQSAVERLQAAGATMVRQNVPVISEAHELSPVLFAGEAHAVWQDLIDAAPDKVFPEILKRFRSGGRFSASNYITARRKLDEMRGQWRHITAPFDAVLTPTAPILPPNIERLARDRDYYVSQNLATLRNTRIGNLFGLCGLTLPTGLPSVGVQMLGSPGSEPQLLRLGRAAELALA